MIRVREQDNNNRVQVSAESFDTRGSIRTNTSSFLGNVTADDNTDELAVGLAKDWAIKTDGKVNNVEYSSKYYAGLAKSFVETAMTPATTTKLGMIKVGENLSVTEEGTLSADTYSETEIDTLLDLKADTSDIPVNVSELNNDSDYVTKTRLDNELAHYTAPIPVATSSVLGGVKIGSGINVTNDGTISASSRNIGEIVASTIPLTDAGLHLLDGALIQGDGIYSAFVDYIAGLDLTANYFCTEQEWQASVTQYGVCGKFVYDSTNNTVRLPKLYSNERYLIASSSSGTEWYRVYSDGWCEQGGVVSWLVNPTLTVSLLKAYANTNYSVFTNCYGTNQDQFPNAIAVNNKTTNTFELRPYTNNRTANWYTCGYIDITDYAVSEKYEYIVIATSTKTDIQVDIDEIATDLNRKADVDLSNVPNSKGILTESYINGSSWYRVYSDGWCVQGGLIVQNSNYTRTINLLKSYSNTDYICIVCAGRNTSTGDGYGYIGTRNTDSFQCVILDATSINACWQASGYIN